MFGFSRRRMKLGRLKFQQSDSASGTRSPIRQQPKRNGRSNSETAAPASGHSDELDGQCSSAAPVGGSSTVGSSENWMVLSISGDKPTPRFNHAAAVIGNKMIVVGGESANGLLDDVQVYLDNGFFETLLVTEQSAIENPFMQGPLYALVDLALSMMKTTAIDVDLKVHLQKRARGSSIIAWGKKALLIGGKTEPWSEKITVWAFDTETECWSLVEAKGDIPVARCGHSVVRASSVLILFGGEDAKRRKLNDLHMFDLKSLMWLPLHCTGTGPSPRSNHMAALYDDKTLYIFGGASKSRTLNDLYSLDFETMIWSRIKVRGFHPSPIAGSCGVLRGTKWYIVGGGSKKKRRSETLIFDILKVEWSVTTTARPSSITTSKGFSLVFVQHKDKNFLVAFGGSKKEASDQVEVMAMEKIESPISRQPFPRKGPGSLLLEKCSSSTGLASQLNNGSSQRTADSVARQNLASAIEQHGSGRLSLSESSLIDPNPVPGNVSLRKQFVNEEEYNSVVKKTKAEDESSFSLAAEHKVGQSDRGTRTSSIGGKFHVEDMLAAHEPESSNLHNQGSGSLAVDSCDSVLPENDSKLGALSAPSCISQFYETKMTTLIRKNALLEGQLAAALASREAAEKNLSSALKSKLEMEKKLAEMMKGMELLKEKLAGVELAQEEANSLSNIVHSDNVRLEHDVAFLKAVWDDTQKELHSTIGVLAGERARAFQLQVEVFHLKQKLQSMENRAPTPRKPFHV
ncbi:BTB-kelch protein [Parasponia andersonii]|uniref:BTB-kelch protein n=1 Tax=Parasponia andersonii TaxID=3476 RepID=A0A2P5E431_PARAD|nr:BTB-kelch protein [Parasponia andersonii]